MRNRHVPRLCRSCDAPMARQEDACWRCGTAWAEEDAANVVRLPVRREPAAATPDADRSANDGGTSADRDGAVVAAGVGGR